MQFIPRAIRDTVLEAGRNFPAVVLTGRRRSGKTSLLRRLFPRASYVLLEDPDTQGRARSDPRALLEELRLPALFDEIQNVPELFSYIRTRIDQNPREMGQWLFTGSQEVPLMQHVSESIARARRYPAVAAVQPGRNRWRHSPSWRVPGDAGASQGARVVVQFRCWTVRSTTRMRTDGELLSVHKIQNKTRLILAPARKQAVPRSLRVLRSRH
jgi:hypothetical protein